jgi:hypothetical protein
MTEKELNQKDLLKEGIYDFEVGQAVDKVSKAGNEMIQLDLTVYDSNGKKYYIYDYILESFPKKFHHAVKACGLLKGNKELDLYATDFIGKCGKVQVGIEADKTGQFWDRNVILDYIVNADESSKLPEKKVNMKREIDDEIPF